MLRKLTLLFVIIFTCSLFGVKWLRDYEAGIEKATKQEKPVLFLYFNHNQQESMKLSYAISKGHLDGLKDKFIFVEMNVTQKKNADRMKSYNINETPMFVLQDFEPKRKLSVKILFIQPTQIFNALFEVYSKLGNEFLNLGDIGAAENAFNLISDIPNELGVMVKDAIKRIDKFKKENNINTTKTDDIKKAQSYFDQASVSIKNGNFDKAYLYLEKVIELAPKSKIAKKAQIEMEKIYDLVDKSKFVKKKDTKGTKK